MNFTRKVGLALAAAVFSVYSHTPNMAPMAKTNAVCAAIRSQLASPRSGNPLATCLYALHRGSDPDSPPSPANGQKPAVRRARDGERQQGELDEAVFIA